MPSECPTIVQAVYSFKGKNNDELNFKKGDVITITQKLEGGWWEGTLEGKTGWFPSNYVKDAKILDVKSTQSALFAVETPPEQQLLNRELILKDIIESERSHIDEVQNLIKTILTPLGSTDLLSDEEYGHVIGNLAEVLELHNTLLAQLEDCYVKASGEQRVGHIFLSMAEKMKNVHTNYCSNHPRAVCILENYKDKLTAYLEGIGCRSPSLVFFTAGLSRPFRRLERYGGCLQEMERHMEEFHPDRGDTQRSVFLYQNLTTSCGSVRRQKEQELEVLCGSVRFWEGDEPHRLGELLYMGPVKITSSNTEVRDRHLVLFSQCIVLLSISQRLSAFVFEKKLHLNGISLNIQDDSEILRLSFEIVVGPGERMTVTCPSREERQRLTDSLQKQLCSSSSSTASPSSTMTPYMPVTIVPPSTSVQQPIPLVSKQQYATSVVRNPSNPALTSAPANQSYLLNQRFSNTLTSNQINNRVWTSSCLRPFTPLRPCPPSGREDRTKKNYKSSKKKEMTYEDDSQLLQMVEAYCLTARSRQTVKSTLIEYPQVLIAEEEKIIVEDVNGGQTVVQEKSLVDTVYALRDQVRGLQSQVTTLAREVEQLKAKNP